MIETLKRTSAHNFLSNFKINKLLLVGHCNMYIFNLNSFIDIFQLFLAVTNDDQNNIL